jgi:hypothetical protein
MAADFGELLKTGTWPAFDPLNTVLLEQTRRAPGAPTGDGPARATIIDYGNARVRISVDAPRGGWLVLNDAAAGPARGGFRVQAVARIVARLARTIAGPPCVRPNGAA